MDVLFSVGAVASAIAMLGAALLGRHRLPQQQRVIWSWREAGAGRTENMDDK